MEYYITRASFNLTRSCNLRCTYPCFNYGVGKGNMSKETAMKGIDWLFENAIKETDRMNKNVEISFWGGEPLLRWDLIQFMTKYAEEKSKRTGIPVIFGGTTNGTLLTPEKFDFLDEHKIFFMVSIDGTKETHDTHRKFATGEGSHDVVIKNFINVLKRWPFYRARLSPSAQRIDHFYEDMKYLFDLGCNYVMFSPAYETGFTDDHWKIFEEQCYKLIDYMYELRKSGRNVEVEHFRSYIGKDNSKWPCGSGRIYCHINHEGYIFSCHRAEKFSDTRPFEEHELCLGHIDKGITKPEVRQLFIDFKPECGSCERLEDTPCHGGCFIVNWDFNKDIRKPYEGICKYVAVQKRVSNYYKEKLGGIPMEQNLSSCICNNMCYAENTPQQIINVDPKTDATCICNFANYNGPVSETAGRPLTPEERKALLEKRGMTSFMTSTDREMLIAILQNMDKRLKILEDLITNKKNE